VLKVGPYALEEEIARGGGAVVYRARGPEGQPVALKVEAGTHERARQRFLREGQALARLRHPNLVACLDAGHDGQNLYLALELAEGGTLAERLRFGPLDQDDAARMVQQVADALAHAHEQGVLHRDLKPENVLLRSDGQPLLTDFGLTRLFHEDMTKLSQTGHLQGTPGYWAPEQARGDPQAIGPHTDVYGLGALLYACLSGQAPIRGSTLAEVASATALGKVAPLGPGVDPRLTSICMRCLATTPEARFPSVAVVAAALADYSGPPAAERLRPAAAASALIVLGAVAALVVVFSAGPRSGAGSPGSRAAGSAPARSGSISSAAPDAQWVKRQSSRLFRGEAALVLVDSDRALEALPHHDVALSYRALALAALGRDEEALQAADHAVRVGQAAEAYEARMRIRTNQGDYEGAAADARAALDQGHETWLVHAALGQAAQKRGAHTEAIDHFDKALALTTGAISVYYQRAQAHVALNDFAAARAGLDEAIRLLGDRHDAYPSLFHLRAHVLLQFEDAQGALRDLDVAVRVDPGNAEGWRNRGLIRGKLGDGEGALADYAQVLALAPHDPWTRTSRAELLVGKPEELATALADVEQVLGRTPDYAFAWRVRGDVLSGMRKPEEALPAYTRALELAPRDVLANYNRGIALAQLRRFEEAAADVANAIDCLPVGSKDRAEFRRVLESLRRQR
jgi:serine/threonine-protein kinase